MHALCIIHSYPPVHATYPFLPKHPFLPVYTQVFLVCQVMLTIISFFFHGIVFMSKGKRVKRTKTNSANHVRRPFVLCMTQWCVRMHTKFRLVSWLRGVDWGAR